MCLFSFFSFQFQANYHSWDVLFTDNRIMQADNIVVKPHPSPISLFVDTSINRPFASHLLVESDHEDEEDPYSNIALPPTTMDPTVPIVHQPVTVSNPL